MPMRSAKKRGPDRHRPTHKKSHRVGGFFYGLMRPKVGRDLEQHARDLLALVARTWRVFCQGKRDCVIDCVK